MWIGFLLTAALIVIFVFLRLNGPPWFDANVRTYLLAALSASAGVTLLHWISFILLDVVFRRRKGREAPQLIRMVVAILGYATIFVVIYSGVFGRNLSNIMAASAVLSVILGLALQDTLGNFFAGISIHMEQPFHLGDSLRIADVVGRVESVTWRTTAVRTNDNSLVMLPNSKIAREAIEVFRLHSLNRRILRIPAPYSVSPQTVIRLAREIAAAAPKVSKEKPPEARVADFSDSSIIYEVLYWIDDYLWAHEIEAIIRERLWYAFGRHQIEIPFPVRHVLLERRRPGITESIPDREAVLAAVEILSPLNPRELKEVAQALESHIFAPGEIVLRTGDTGDSMFVIYRGSAEVLAADADGHLRQLAVLEARDVLVEMALFTGEPRRADVRSLAELEVFEIRKPVIAHLLQSNAALAEAFSKIIATRQLQLSQLAEARTDGAAAVASDNILKRIKKFFNLG
jgi:small-conductance mechanosensitive channel/CRP-like cAMP-binding protein